MNVFLLKLLIFIFASAGIVLISWDTLKKPRSHGFYRTFAWEFILILFLINVEYWFRTPFSWNQIIAWILLILSLILILHAVYLFRILGEPDDSVEDEVPKVGIEKTTRLVTVGAYRFVRHPFYGSLLFLAWGIYFKLPSWIGTFLAVVTTGFLYLTAKIEEKENIAYFGRAYVEYMQKTKMFIPYIL